MIDVSRSTFGKLPLALAKQINQICNQFEAAWKQGQRPRMELFLHAVDEADRLRLLSELVPLEIAYRKQAGEALDSTEYLMRFPTLEHVWLEKEIAAADIPRQIGRYVVEKELGRGSFGVVYLARDEQLQRLVAIKVPHRRFISRPDDAGPYLAEARTVANLDHANIVPVHDFGSNEHFPCFIVSRYVEGSTLSQIIRGQRPSLGEAAAMLATIAKSLHYAHVKGVVHRDIKPGNILIDNKGEPFIVDFGLALKEENIGHGPNYVGTPPYMSPEQARGEGHRVDGRSDIFSLGIVFYELITGQRPFCGETWEDLLQQIAAFEVLPPRQINEAIPNEIERICLKALSKRVDDRYLTGSDLAEDLERWQAGGERRELAGADLAAPSAAGLQPTSDTPAPASSAPPIAPPRDSGSHKVVPKGLRSFDAHDAGFFLDLIPGPRDRDGLPESIRFWKTRIEQANADVTFNVGLIYGPSGCGKSSLVKAGLLPRLADNVVAVYVETTAEETEKRLLAKLRQRFPALPSKLGLKKSLATLRNGQAIPSKKKVLIVLDQFEQWLHAKKDEVNTELVQALRQCDGIRLQCIILVRDDFWMAATRFMRELEIRIVEGLNSAAVDLFPLKHAENVLGAFGRAFGTLPQTGALGKEHKQFLEQSIRGLAQDGKVICIRLAMFAEMMKGKTWTPSALKEVGGTEGVGVAFLRSTFSAPTAPPQKAARAVLKLLLPEIGTDIKGHKRSRAELLDASGLESRPNDFDELIRVLDSDIRLITPTDREGKEGDLALPSNSEPRQAYYQLTHDYLVPSLRDWLTREQRETRRGRAELLLADRATVWNDRPETRRLPSLLDWTKIKLLTRKKDWTPAQSSMMKKAGTYHLVRSVVAALVLVLATWAIYEGHGALTGHALRNQLLKADTKNVPSIVVEMEPYRRWIDQLLRDAYREAEASEKLPYRKQLHASIALLRVDPSQKEYLFTRLLDAAPQDVAVLCDVLAPHQKDLLDRLWTVAEQHPAKGKEGQRLRAACALANFDADNDRWDKVADRIVNDFVSEPPVYLNSWMDSLRPARGRLQDYLGVVYRDTARPQAERIVTDILADFVYDQPRVLAELLMDATERQFPHLFSKLNEQQRGSLLPFLNAEIDKHLVVVAGADAKDVLAKRQANAIIALFRMDRPSPLLPSLRHSPDPSLRSFLIHRLGSLGADPMAITKSLNEERDVTVRRALILSLGEFRRDNWPPGESDLLVTKMRDVYRKASDPGLRAAAEWLLRTWKEEAWLVKENAELAKDLERRTMRLASLAHILGTEKQKAPQWYVDGHGQTMVVIPGPVEVVTETPLKEAGQNKVKQSRKTIGRTFAISAKMVTVGDFLRFSPIKLPQETGPVMEYPVVFTSWLRAAAYCNFLSKEEGIDPEQWCYETDSLGNVIKMKENYLSLSGYRLPTVAEMDYSIRAETSSSRFFGEAKELMIKYGWCAENANGAQGPVGRLKPNDFGLFDMLGNVWSWCQDLSQDPRPGSIDQDSEDVESSELVIDSEKPRVLRGACYTDEARKIRSDSRYQLRPGLNSNIFGFRVARTVIAKSPK